MPLNAQQAVKALADEAGWRVPAPDAAGVFRIFLDEGLDLELSSPDGRLFVASASLGAAPAADEEDEWLRLGKLSAASMRAQDSALSVHEGELVLSRRMDLTRDGPSEIAEAIRRFLNDQAWWHEALSGEAPSAPSSPFAMPGGWFPGDFQL